MALVFTTAVPAATRLCIPQYDRKALNPGTIGMHDKSSYYLKLPEQVVGDRQPGAVIDQSSLPIHPGLKTNPAGSRLTVRAHRGSQN